MEKKMFTVAEARVHLRERGISVSRQALHLLIARHRAQCQRIGGSDKRVGIWRIPASLLRTYRPLAQQQRAGYLNRPR